MAVCGDFDRGAVPAHVSKSLLARLLDFSGRLDDGLHELQVAAAQLNLRRHQARQPLTVLGLVDVRSRLRQCSANRTERKTAAESTVCGNKSDSISDVSRNILRR